MNAMVKVSAAHAVIACGVIGLVVTERTIRTWREAGLLPVFDHGPHGINLYDLADITRLARVKLSEDRERMGA